jgi:hypothetical protein
MQNFHTKFEFVNYVLLADLMLFFAILHDILVFHGTMFQFLKHLDPQLYIQLLFEKFTIMINDAMAFIVQFKL